LCQDYAQFQAAGAEIIALGPDGPDAFRAYWRENELPFIGCSDIQSKVAKTFHQEVNLFKLGRMPALFIIDSEGCMRYRQYGDSMSDIPTNAEVLEKIAALQS
jgi:peroxiredoxin